MQKKKYGKLKNALAITLAMELALLQPIPALAASDISGHWAQEVMESWLEQGLISGYDNGLIKPDKSVTRAEFVRLINQRFSLSGQAQISFNDVSESDWFFQEVLTAVANGYASGFDDGGFHPDEAITRGQAAVLVANTLKLPFNAEAGKEFTDVNSFPQWAAGAIGALSQAGVFMGYPDNTFQADRVMTRAEAVSLLDKAFLYNQQPDEAAEAIETLESLTIARDGEIAADKRITGDVTISEDVGDGSVELKNITIEGKLIINGGGSNSVTLDGCQIAQAESNKANVRVVLKGNTNINLINANAPLSLTEEGWNGKLNEVILLSNNSNEAFNLNAPIDLLRLSGKAGVNIRKSINELTVEPGAEGVRIEFFDNVKINAVNGNAMHRMAGYANINIFYVNVNGISWANAIQFGNIIYGPNTNYTTYGERRRGGGGGGDDDDDVVSVTGVSVSSQPARLSYFPGDALDLSGMKITLSYSNNETKEIALEDMAANDITVSPANGYILSAADNGKPIVVTYTKTSLTASTANLTVNEYIKTPMPEFLSLLSSIDGSSASFSMKTEPEAGEWKVYDSATATTPSSAVTAMVSGNSLTLNNASVSGANTRYWVTLTGSAAGFLESDRLELTVYPAGTGDSLPLVEALGKDKVIVDGNKVHLIDKAVIEGDELTIPENVILILESGSGVDTQGRQIKVQVDGTVQGKKSVLLANSFIGAAGEIKLGNKGALIKISNSSDKQTVLAGGMNTENAQIKLENDASLTLGKTAVMTLSNGAAYLTEHFEYLHSRESVRVDEGSTLVLMASRTLNGRVDIYGNVIPAEGTNNYLMADDGAGNNMKSTRINVYKGANISGLLLDDEVKAGGSSPIVDENGVCLNDYVLAPASDKFGFNTKKFTTLDKALIPDQLILKAPKVLKYDESNLKFNPTDDIITTADTIGFTYEDKRDPAIASANSLALEIINLETDLTYKVSGYRQAAENGEFYAIISLGDKEYIPGIHQATLYSGIYVSEPLEFEIKEAALTIGKPVPLDENGEPAVGDIKVEDTISIPLKDTIDLEPYTVNLTDSFGDTKNPDFEVKKAEDGGEGEYQVMADLAGIPAGNYDLTISSGSYKSNIIRVSIKDVLGIRTDKILDKDLNEINPTTKQGETVYFQCSDIRGVQPASSYKIELGLWTVTGTEWISLEDMEIVATDNENEFLIKTTFADTSIKPEFYDTKLVSGKYSATGPFVTVEAPKALTLDLLTTTTPVEEDPEIKTEDEENPEQNPETNPETEPETMPDKNPETEGNKQDNSQNNPITTPENDKQENNPQENEHNTEGGDNKDEDNKDESNNQGSNTVKEPEKET